MAKLPSFPFYPGDWLRNGVAGCSLEAQGLWLRMMIVMHDADVYGELSIKGEPMPDEFIAKKCGISRRKYQKILENLESFSVINRTNNGVIYSGRMVRDEAKRQQNARRQRKFYDEHERKPNAKPNTPSSSSSSVSSSSLGIRKEEITEVSIETPNVSKLKSRPKKDRDSRIDHLAVKTVHQILARWPHKDLWDRIIRELGDNPDTEFFRSCYEIWRSVNGNPMNLEKWLFEPNRTKKPPEIYGQKSNGVKPNPMALVGKGDSGPECPMCDSVRFIDEGGQTVPCPSCRADDHSFVKSKQAA